MQLFPSAPPPTETFSRLTPLRGWSALVAFSELGPFRKSFYFLTAVSVFATLLRFASVAVLGSLVSDATNITIDEILYHLLPLLVGAQLGAELLDYYIRRYGEPFSRLYSDHLLLRMMRTIQRVQIHRLVTVSQERLVTSVSRYVNAVGSFTGDWFWNISRRITSFIVILFILAAQDWYVLLANVLFFIGYMWFSFHLASQTAPYASILARETVRTDGEIGVLYRNLPFLKRIGQGDSLYKIVSTSLGSVWLALLEFQKFHALRWVLQLNLYSIAYIGTLAYGAIQVQRGEIGLGFLVLIKYAFDNLQSFCIMITEQYGKYIQEREMAARVSSVLELLGEQRDEQLVSLPVGWRELSLRNIQIQFPQQNSIVPVDITVPSLTVIPGGRVGIMGPSGVGKSSTLLAIAGLMPFVGKRTLDGQDIGSAPLDFNQVHLCTPHDPFYPLSIRDNLLLGSTRSDAELWSAVKLSRADEFVTSLDTVIGQGTNNFSTGQLQRLRLTRVFLSNAEVLLLDEPFTGIDQATRQQIARNLSLTISKRISLVVVSHQESDLGLLEAECFIFVDGKLTRK